MILYTIYYIFELYNNKTMAKDKDGKEIVVEDEFSTELKGTFFDTFAFPTEEPKKEEPKKEEPKVETPKTTATSKKEEPKEEPKKEEPKKEEPKEEPKVDPDVQLELDKVATAIKAKDEKDLDDEEKEFLKEYDAGTLKKEPEPEKTGYDVLSKTLIDEGVLEETEDLKDTPESFSEVVTKTVDKRVDDYIAEIPDEYRNIIDFMRNGGSANEYLQSKATIDYSNLNLKDEGIQNALVAEILKQENYTEDEIKEKLLDYKDLDRLEKEAKRASKVFAKQQDDRVKAYDKSIIKATKDQEKAEEAEIEELGKTIDSLKEIAGFKLNKKRKDDFKKYLFDVDNQGETAASRASKLPENRIKLYFMDFVGYKFDDLEKAATTKKTNDFSKLLSRYKDTQTKTTGVTIEEKNPEGEKFELKIPSMFNRAPED